MRPPIQDRVRWSRPLLVTVPSLRRRPELLAAIVKPLAIGVQTTGWGPEVQQGGIIPKEIVTAQAVLHHAPAAFRDHLQPDTVVLQILGMPGLPVTSKAEVANQLYLLGVIGCPVLVKDIVLPDPGHRVARF